MDIEIKKDKQTIEISKDAIIIGLSIALVLSLIAMCFMANGGRHKRGGFEKRGMMNGFSQEQRMMFPDRNFNPNNANMQGGQIPVSPSETPSIETEIKTQ